MIIAQQSAEMAIASYLTDPLTGGSRLIEIILERGNMDRALKQVRSNKGAPGIDGMTVDQLPSYLRRHWQKVKVSLLDGTYTPLPVRRKEIPKPQGGVRMLGIPTVLDRVLQQAISQVLQKIWEPVFSDFSYGFRPGRCQHQAIQRVKQYTEDRYRHVVDMDLSKFFDRVSHDRLMSRLAAKISDKRLLKLIRKFLTSGVMIGGPVEPQNEGAPQGGPLSPLLSNIVLDELDKELERRGLRFVRYADDFVIHVGSRKAADRVMRSVSRFITNRLRLQVNEEKSKITHPWWMCFLGFSFTSKRGDTRIRIHSKSIQRFKNRVRELTARNSAQSIHQIIFNLNEYLRGWWNYYRLTQSTSRFRSLHGWIMRRLRAILWKQWKNPRTRIRELRKRGVSHGQAVFVGNACKRAWRMSKTKWVIIALPNAYFRRTLGLFLPGFHLLP
ncbi:group II intron reverse transcriptase/maturase [Desulfogranum japonicum]|uniref:group II intron reverse transcriptase/maturase n=1 Tax=Desulfogranum japonicum TaxID=231447 RepID=UPI00040ED5BC|nr:group II intron reverse transcriptase/maturase [Desulfogranum japonicum]